MRWIAPADADGFVDQARVDGGVVYALPELVRDRAGFFRAIRATLPLNPPVLSDDAWDALADSLWQGLYELDAQRVAIVWPRPALMQEHAGEDFAIALGVLAQVVDGLADRAQTVDAPKDVVVVLVGDGAR